jgi:hypothetical protein
MFTAGTRPLSATRDEERLEPGPVDLAGLGEGEQHRRHARDGATLLKEAERIGDNLVPHALNLP